jgi:RIO kinase 2
MLEQILDCTRRAKAGVIHADLSEYNILIEDEKAVIIDWPQWIGTDHPNAVTIIERDIDNILAFFTRKYRLHYSRKDAVLGVIG